MHEILGRFTSSPSAQRDKFDCKSENGPRTNSVSECGSIKMLGQGKADTRQGRKFIHVWNRAAKFPSVSQFLSTRQNNRVELDVNFVPFHFHDRRNWQRARLRGSLATRVIYRSSTLCNPVSTSVSSKHAVSILVAALLLRMPVHACVYARTTRNNETSREIPRHLA